MPLKTSVQRVRTSSANLSKKTGVALPIDSKENQAGRESGSLCHPDLSASYRSTHPRHYKYKKKCNKFGLQSLPTYLIQLMADEKFKKELVDALPGARRYARTLMREPADADDLVQEAIERAIKNWDSFEPGTNLNAWVNRIIKNIFLDQIKSHGVSRTTQLGDDEAGIMEKELSEPAIAEMEMEISEIQDYLFTLSEDERSVVMLWAEGFTYQEIADQLNLSRANAGVILCRARESINRRFRRQ